MNERRIDTVVWGGLALVIALILGAFLVKRSRSSSPSSAVAFPVYSVLNDFKLTNHLGRTVSLADLRGKIWVADLIFTRCPGPCAQLSRQMSQLQTNLADLPDVHLVSLTADPDYDSPQVLKRYAKTFEAQDDRWWFLTGNKQELLTLITGTNGLMLVALEKNLESRQSENDLFLHSTRIMMVDAQGRLRAFFESEDPELFSKIRQTALSLRKEKSR